MKLHKLLPSFGFFQSLRLEKIDFANHSGLVHFKSLNFENADRSKCIKVKTKCVTSVHAVVH